MSIDRSPGANIEYYEEAAAIMRESDRVELDVHIMGWSRKLRIRALSFKQMELINRMATISDNEPRLKRVAGELDHEEWVYWTIKEGVVRPYFTIAQARELCDNNGEFVRELADEIWNLGRISQKMWDAFISEQTRLSEIEKTGNPDAASNELQVE